jgi:hypothetical protein
MTTTRRTLRAAGILAGVLVVAGTAAATTVRHPFDRFDSPQAGMTLDPATHAFSLTRTVQHTATRPLHSWMSARAKSGKKLVYVSDLTTGSINIYPAGVDDPAPVGSITGLVDPDGLNFDARGNLYVAVAGGGGVEVFPPGSTTPSFKYSNIVNPVSVIVDSNNVVYAGLGDLGGDQVVEFNVGSNTPVRTISGNALGNGAPYGLAIGAHGDLYVGTGEEAVYRFAPGATTGKNLGLVGMKSSRGITLDGRDNVFATGFYLGGGNFVSEYLAGQEQIDRQFLIGPQPFEVAFGKEHKLLYVAQVGYTKNGTVQAYSYKTAGLVLTIRNGLESPIGVALTPDVQ